MTATVGPTAARLKDVRAELTKRWPKIGQWLRVQRGEVSFDDVGWMSSVQRNAVHGEDLATAYEQQAAYYEWLLKQRTTGHLADDRIGQHLCAKWTDSMTYCCRRLASLARGDDPGAWISQHVRRPDLDICRAVKADADADHSTDWAPVGVETTRDIRDLTLAAAS